MHLRSDGFLFFSQPSFALAAGNVYSLLDGLAAEDPTRLSVVPELTFGMEELSILECKPQAVRTAEAGVIPSTVWPAEWHPCTRIPCRSDQSRALR